MFVGGVLQLIKAISVSGCEVLRFTMNRFLESVCGVLQYILKVSGEWRAEYSSS